ncbi:MAG: sugar phosphate isomerase/epimerase [Bryobacteraceae bacterium]
MTRRRNLHLMAAALASLRERAVAQSSGRNISWAASMFLWTSTQWKTDGSARFTDMLDVIKDAGLDGFRLTGWPKSLETYNMPAAVLEKELSRRRLRLATLSFGGDASNPAAHASILASAHEACKMLKHFGSDVLTVFSPRRPNKVLVRHHMKIACDFWNRLGELSLGYGIRSGSHNHSQGQLVENQDEVELMLSLTDPKRFNWSPDTIHLYLGGCDIRGLFEKYAHRLISMDYVDAKYVYATSDLHLPNGRIEKAGTQEATFMLCNQDFGDGEVPLPALTAILKKVQYRGWITIDHHYAPVSPLHSLSRCRRYIGERLEPIYR